MVTAAVVTIVLLLVFALVVAVARDRGPGPADTAVSYEDAWDRLDFDALFTLSGAELRDGLERKDYVAAKRAAYAKQQQLGGLVERVSVEDVAEVGGSAVVITGIALRDGSRVRNRVDLVRRNQRWQVVSYQLVPTVDDASSST